VPELPEVTVISGDVASLAAGRKVVRAGISDDDVSNAGVEGFPVKLVGRTLLGTSRRGKIIVLDFGEVVGVVHLVISGRVLGFPEWQEPDRMNTVMLEFEGGVVLGFTRLWLGYFDLYDPGEVDKHPLISRLGPDPFSPEFTVGYLTEAFSGRRAAIKGLLLNQSLVAGLGNIYVDEVLFAAGVHPARKADTLTLPETEALHAAILDILERAIQARGTTFDSYHDAFGETGKFQHQLRVFDQEGGPCPACGTEIVKLKVAGRGTHICPACQAVGLRET
jgi:formamidopyrimidine-DNA glycosylase